MKRWPFTLACLVIWGALATCDVATSDMRSVIFWIMILPIGLPFLLLDNHRQGPQ